MYISTHLNTYGITENKQDNLLDQILAFELGDLDNTQTAELFTELENKGQYATLERLKAELELDTSPDAYIVDYEELTV